MKLNAFLLSAVRDLTFIAVFSSPAAASDLLADWNQLLHFGNETSRVISEEFFVSANGRSQATEELAASITLLQGGQGKRFACQFPARYLLLRKHMPTLPEFDLADCPELQTFLMEMQGDELSLVYASEYLDSPASAFGHILLLIRDRNASIDLGIAVHFAAETEKVGGSAYITRGLGLSQRFDAYFMRERFFRKRFEYNQQEQRALHVYPLNIKKGALAGLKLHLYELRKARFQYQFIQENCAYQIAHLVKLAHETPYLPETKWRTLPIEVVKNNKDAISGKEVYLPTITRLNALSNSLSPTELDQARQRIETGGADAEKDSSKINETIHLFHEYQFRRHRKNVSAYADASVIQYIPSTESQQPKIAEPLNSKPGGRLGAGTYWDEEGGKPWFRFRMFNRDHDDLADHIGMASRSTLNLLAVELTGFPGTSNALHIRRLDLISIESNPPPGPLIHPLGWKFWLGGNRENHNENYRHGAEIGIGRSDDIRSLWLSAQLGGGVEFEKGEPLAYASFTATSQLDTGYGKLGVQWRTKRSAQEEHRMTTVSLSMPEYITFDNWLFVIRGEYTSALHPKRWMFSVNRYF